MARIKALTSLTLASIIVGSTLVVSKIISGGNSIYTMQFLAMVIACIVLYCINGRKNLMRELNQFTKRDHLLFFLQTLTGVVLFRVLIVYGVRMTRAIDAGIIMSLIPVITVIMSIIFLKEKLGKIEIIAVTCSVIGLLCINLDGIDTNRPASMSLIGNIFILLAVIGEGAFVIFSKISRENIPPTIKAFSICFYGGILLLPLSVWEIVVDASFAEDYLFWIMTLYTGLILTVSAQVLWFNAIDKASGLVAAVFNSLIPISGIGFVVIIFKEQILTGQIMGFMMVMAGVLLVLIATNRSVDEDKSFVARQEE